MLPSQENARLGRKANFAPGRIPLGGESPKNVYTVYQPSRWPNIVQSLTVLNLFKVIHNMTTKSNYRKDEKNLNRFLLENVKKPF